MSRSRDRQLDRHPRSLPGRSVAFPPRPDTTSGGKAAPENGTGRGSVVATAPRHARSNVPSHGSPSRYVRDLVHMTEGIGQGNWVSGWDQHGLIIGHNVGNASNSRSNDGDL
jgi:hypothetical protein